MEQKQAIEQLNEKLNRKVKEVTTLYSFGETTSVYPLNRDTILRALINMAKEVTLAKRISFFASDGNGAEMKILMQSPEEPPRLMDGPIASERQRLVEKAAGQVPLGRAQGDGPGDPLSGGAQGA